MPQVKLSDVAIRALPLPPQGQVTHWDETLPGFGVRVSQGGTKTFIVIYGPTRRRYTVGRYGQVSLKQAREEARKLQAGLTLGIIEKKKSPIYTDARDQFLEHCRAKNRPKTVYEYARHLKGNFPFGRTRLADIQRHDIQRRLNKMKDTPSERHHAFVAFKCFLNWAVSEEMIEVNPVANLKLPNANKPRERFLTEDELREVFTKAQEQPWPYGSILQLLILTGQRKMEIGSLEWSWIDQEDQTITLPGHFTKNGKPHRFPYGNIAANIFETLPQTDETYVFPGHTKNAVIFNGWSKCKKRFDEGLDDVEPFTLHDLRRTFSSNLAMLGTPIHVTEKLLNHISGTISGVAAIYNRHSYMDEMREAVSAYDEYLENLINS